MIIKLQSILLLLIVSGRLFCSEDVKPYINGDIFCQLGNQFFQVAATLSLAIDNDAVAVFPEFRRFSCNKFQENYEKIFFRLNDRVPKRKAQAFFKEQHHTYSPIPYTPDMRIRGFFQSEKYFKHNKEKILPLFEPLDDVVREIFKKHSWIIEHSNTVAIHVRTYEKDDPKHEVYYLNGREYVSKALSLFPEDILCVVFSDNIPWTKKELSGLRENMYFVEGQSYINDFFLMSYCRHQIISNSTFSWWAAYLNKNDQKIVVAPGKWFVSRGDSSDLIPEDWVVIE